VNRALEALRLESLANDAKYGIRGLIRQPGFTAVALIALAIGIGMNTAIFSVVNAVLLRPLPYPRPDQLVWMAETGEVTNRFVSYANFKDWRQSNQSFQALSTVRAWPLTLTGIGEAESVTAQMVAAGFFTVLGARPVMGRVFTNEDESDGALVTVVSYDFWNRRLGADPNAIGKTVRLDDKPFQIVGVMPLGFKDPDRAPLWVLVGGGWATAAWNERDVRMAGYVIGRLKPDVTLEQAGSDMGGISEGLIERYPVANAGRHRVEMVSLSDSITREVRSALLILLCAVGLVLLIACANVASLSLARGSSRQKELWLRAALGAGRWRIVRQLLTESIILALAGGLAGLLLASWGVHLLSRLEQRAIPRLEGAGIDIKVLTFTLLASGLTGIGFGLVPAWGSGQLLVAGGQRGMITRGSRAWGRGLVMVEMALALMLLTGCGLMIKSLMLLLGSNPGFDPRNVVTMKIVVPATRYPDKGRQYRLDEQLLEHVSALPGVEHASISNNLPGLVDGWQTDIFPEGHARLAPGEILNVDWSIVTADYFATMRIPILQGRTFTAAEVQKGSPVVLVDEGLAREFWPGGDALGKHIKYDSPDNHEIIGIVKSVSVFGSQERPRIKIYTPAGRSSLTRTVLSIRTALADPRSIVDSVAREVRAVDQDLPVTDAATMEEVLGRQAAPRRFSAGLFTLFAAVALGLAGIGIFGVTSYSVSHRTNEIGVRMALGAKQDDVLKMILWHGMTQAAVGVLFGLAGALILTRAMKSLLYGVNASDPVTFAAAATLLVLVGMLACYIPAKRATRMDPLVALRHE
jgi:predicted permease